MDEWTSEDSIVAIRVQLIPSRGIQSVFRGLPRRFRDGEPEIFFWASLRLAVLLSYPVSHKSMAFQIIAFLVQERWLSLHLHMDGQFG